MCGVLAHRFPRVRRYAAENLYVCLLENPTSFEGDNANIDQALELLLNHPWDGDLDESNVKTMATEVAEKLGVASD